MNKRADIYARFALVIACIVVVCFLVAQTKAPAKPTPKMLEATARGTAWVDSGDLTALAVGAQAHAVARKGRCVAVVPGATATAFDDSLAGGGPGSAITLVRARKDGQAGGGTWFPGRTCEAWTWYRLDAGPRLVKVGAMTKSDVAAFQAAGKAGK